MQTLKINMMQRLGRNLTPKPEKIFPGYLYTALQRTDNCERVWHRNDYQDSLRVSLYRHAVPFGRNYNHCDPDKIHYTI